MIGEVALAIEMGADEVDIGKTIHPHPTLGESIGMAAEVAHGTCTDVPPQQAIARCAAPALATPSAQRRLTVLAWHRGRGRGRARCCGRGRARSAQLRGAAVERRAPGRSPA